MENIRIFCEGYSDQRFLRDFISINYNIRIPDKELKNNFKIHCLGGWHKLKDVKTKITEEFSEYTSLIFLDADDTRTSEKNGIEATQKYVKDLMNEWNWTKYAVYVFPNNQDETGAIEDFLEKIIKPENSDVFKCWNNFEKCLSEKGKGYNIPAKKSKIYAYLEVFHGNSKTEKDKCKDPGRDFTNAKLWDLDVETNPYLKSLKLFLDPYFIR